jgi:hypothetical protein
VLLVAAFSLAAVGVARRAHAADQEQITLHVEIFRIRGDISGGTSLTDNVWGELKGANPHAKDFPFSVFTIADQTLAGVKLEANQKGWFWDGKKEPPAGTGVTKVGAPKVVVQQGQQFKLSVSAQPVQYFERREDGLFELKALDEKPGLSLSGTITKSDDPGRLVFKDLTFAVRLVERRKPIKGVALDVGEPVLTTPKEVKTTLSLKKNYHYGMHVRIRDGKGFLMCHIRAESPK